MSRRLLAAFGLSLTAWALVFILAACAARLHEAEAPPVDESAMVTIERPETTVQPAQPEEMVVTGRSDARPLNSEELSQAVRTAHIGGAAPAATEFFRAVPSILHVANHSLVEPYPLADVSPSDELWIVAVPSDTTPAAEDG